MGKSYDNPRTKGGKKLISTKFVGVGESNNEAKHKMAKKMHTFDTSKSHKLPHGVKGETKEY
jgi:hypothetical protein